MWNLKKLVEDQNLEKVFNVHERIGNNVRFFELVNIMILGSKACL